MHSGLVYFSSCQFQLHREQTPESGSWETSSSSIQMNNSTLFRACCFPDPESQSQGWQTGWLASGAVPLGGRKQQKQHDEARGIQAVTGV